MDELKLRMKIKEEETDIPEEQGWHTRESGHEMESPKGRTLEEKGTQKGSWKNAKARLWLAEVS